MLNGEQSLPLIQVGEAGEDVAPAPAARGLSDVVCLVPDDVPEDIIDALERHFHGTGMMTRVTKGRRRERRSGDDRRNGSGAQKEMLERRIAPDLEMRRFAERRADFERVEPPILPAAAAPYADKLRFVRRRPRPIGDNELGRLRGLAEAWRERARESDGEARGLLRNLVGIVEDLRELRIMSPRWFLAVRRGDKAIAEYRDQHVAR
jgi:hypothetical protein